MRTLIILFLTSPLLSFSYNQTGVLCRVNNAPATWVSCNDGWVEMKSYPEVELRLKDCMSLRSKQAVEVKVENTIYTPNSLSNLAVEYRVGEYLIECTEQQRPL